MGGVGFVQKELSIKSKPQISEVKKNPEELSNQNIIQNNPTL